MVKFDNVKMTIIEYSEYAKLSKLEADQESARHSPATSVGCFQPSLDDTLGKPTVADAVTDKLDSAGFAALLSSARTLATILRHTPAYGRYVQAKQRHIAEQQRWYDDLARVLDQQLSWRGIMAQDPDTSLVVDINIGEPDSLGQPPVSGRAATPHNRLSLRRHVPKASRWTCHRRARGEQETYTTEETLTSVISDSNTGEHIETHSPSSPRVTVSRSTLVEALFMTFSQYGAPVLSAQTYFRPRDIIIRMIGNQQIMAAHMAHPDGGLVLSIAVACGVDEVKAQQLMNELVDRLTKKHIII